MKNFFALLGFSLIVFGAVGWYLQWYHLDSTKNADGVRNISIDVNGPKIKEDLAKGKDKLREILTPEEKAAQQNTGILPTAGTNNGTTTIQIPKLPAVPGVTTTTQAPTTQQPAAHDPRAVFFGPDGTFIFPGEIALPGEIVLKPPTIKLPSLPTPR